MGVRLIRLPEVIHRVGFSRASIYKMIREGTFPRQHKIGPRAVAWTEKSIDDWIREKLDLQLKCVKNSQTNEGKK